MTTHITPQRSLIERFGLTVPVIQAPMAGVSTPALAAAVSNAGGLGSLGLAAMNAAAARTAIEQTRALTSNAFGVNVFCHRPAVDDKRREADWLAHLAPYFAEFGATPPTSLRELYTSFLVDDAMLEMLLAERPAVVSFHFGLPGADRIEALKDAGIFLLASATSLAEAKLIAAAGIDAIVAQGIEAGGHRGVFDTEAPDDALPTMALTRTLVKHIDLPIIAAGGIMDGAGIAAVMALGAQAAQMGTAFISCPESAADAAYRSALVGHEVIPTTLTKVISGRAARGITNRFTAIGEQPDCPRLPDYSIVYDAGKALIAAARAQGNSEFSAQWAGQAAHLSRGIGASELMQALRAELYPAS